MKRRNFIKILASTSILITKPIKLFADELIKKIITPPGSKSKQNLLDNCIQCGVCIESCPNEVLLPASNQYGKGYENVPYLNFSSKFCDYTCNTCSTICPTDAIMELPLKEKQITKIGNASYNKAKCIVITDKTSCGACAEVCPTSAITLKDIGSNLEIPEIKTELCIGCGACEYACPVKTRDAIYVSGLAEHKKAQPVRSEIINEPVKKSKGKTFAF